MTFVNHTIGGVAVGSAMAYTIHYFFGVDWWWSLVIISAILGSFSDTSGWIIYKISNASWWKWKKYDRGNFYGKCHPPYRKEDGHGSIDRIMKWYPSWGLHTWVTDSIVHVTAPKFIFPQFKSEWKYINWLTIRPSHWNLQLSKWDVLYSLLELFLTVIYVLIIIYTII